MQIVGRWLSRVLTCAVASIVLVLALAFGWTILQIASVNDLGRSLAGTTAARRAGYRATATAINVDRERVQSAIWFFCRLAATGFEQPDARKASNCASRRGDIASTNSSS